MQRQVELDFSVNVCGPPLVRQTRHAHVNKPQHVDCAHSGHTQRGNESVVDQVERSHVPYTCILKKTVIEDIKAASKLQVGSPLQGYQVTVRVQRAVG